MCFCVYRSDVSSSDGVLALQLDLDCRTASPARKMVKELDQSREQHHCKLHYQHLQFGAYFFSSSLLLFEKSAPFRKRFGYLFDWPLLLSLCNIADS